MVRIFSVIKTESFAREQSAFKKLPKWVQNVMIYMNRPGPWASQLFDSSKPGGSVSDQFKKFREEGWNDKIEKSPDRNAIKAGCRREGNALYNEYVHGDRNYKS